MDGVSGVGVSFGADRIYDVLNQLNLFSEIKVSSTKILLANFGEKEITYILKVAELLRRMGISTEIYPDSAKLKKQLSYADAKKIQFIIMAGENEISNNQVTVKNMTSGEQNLFSIDGLPDFIRNNASLLQ